MEFFETIKKRHCLRSFDESRPVPEALVKKIIQAGQAAPSAGNMQDWQIKVVKDKTARAKMANLCHGQAFVAQAPVILVICSDLEVAQEHYGQRGLNLYSIQDTAACMENMFLAATALGLGACWVGAFDAGAIKQFLKLPDSWQPYIVMPLGWPKI